jgi:uncharacterized protein
VPVDPTSDADPPVPAGEIGPWLDGVEAAIRGERPSDVPCGTCTACCTSSQFVHIGPDEADALAHVPAELTFPAPGLPPGHVLLGYDERGHCPMLVDGACSIYEHRPRTCRTYDCRVFTVAAVAPGPEQVEIRRRVERWRFEPTTDAERARLDAVRAAAAFIAAPPPMLASAHGVALPTNPTQVAVLAVEIHRAFLDPGAGADDTTDTADLDRVVAEIRRVTDGRNGTDGSSGDGSSGGPNAAPADPASAPG